MNSVCMRTPILLPRVPRETKALSDLPDGVYQRAALPRSSSANNTSGRYIGWLMLSRVPAISSSPPAPSGLSSLPARPQQRFSSPPSPLAYLLCRFCHLFSPILTASLQRIGPVLVGVHSFRLERLILDFSSASRVYAGLYQP